MIIPLMTAEIFGVQILGQFAERDRLWEAGDPAYYPLSDALQYLGNVAFREPVPAYKASAAMFLQLTGRIPSARTHVENPERPRWEGEMLADCALRLQLELKPWPRPLAASKSDAL